MNRREYLEQLKKRLRKLPFDEIREAVDYYEQYFNDAGEENEQAVIAELGPPSNVASQIIAEFAVKGSGQEQSAKRGLSSVWVVILAVFASPVALPLAVAVAAIAFSLVVVMLCLLISIGCTVLAFILTGVMCMVFSIPVLVQNFATALFYFGSGLVLCGIGTALVLPTIALSKKCFAWLAKCVGRFILRRSEK